MTSMSIGGGEEAEKASSGGFQFDEEELKPCFVKESAIKVDRSKTVLKESAINLDHCIARQWSAAAVLCDLPFLAKPQSVADRMLARARADARMHSLCARGRICTRSGDSISTRT
jgi:hypothetical protein